MTYNTLHVNIISISRVVVFIIAVELHEFGLGCHRTAGISQRVSGWVALHVINAKGCFADASPWVMLSLPRLAAEEWLASTRLLALARFEVFAKISPHQIVIGADIELVEKKLDCPWRVLHVKDAQHSFCSPRGMANFTQTVEIIYFLGCYFAGALFAMLPLNIVDEQYAASMDVDLGVVFVPFEAGTSSARWP